MKAIRLFISSPGDAIDARRRVVRVIERLNAAHVGTARFEPVLWEEKFYSAHAGFQEQIVRPAECDVVVAMLRWRLGTPLSPDFTRSLPEAERALPGEAFESGTAYEILSAIAARKHGAPLPDIYVFRESGSPNPALDATDRAEIERQWARLKGFAEKVFVTADGHFKGAYDTYASLDEFETRVEKALRQWLEEKVLRGGAALVWPIAIKGSPFRGLSAFGAKHEEVFFGRDGDCERALDRLKDGAEAGFPFLLIVGPSGAGKSSFARAGIVPRIARPGVVSEASAFRVAVMRPLEDPQGPIAGLARRLFDATKDMQAGEEGRPIALPELSDGDSATPQALNDLFSVFTRGADDDRAAVAVAVAPIARALKTVAAAEREKWQTAEEKPARLLLVIDQLDELFAPGVDEATRKSFALLIGALARSGHVWVVATLRAELYEAFLKSPLAPFASGGERLFNLLPPGLGEMAEVVRGPARAAGLAWQRDASSGERLDDSLIAAIDRPDLLPLVQFALDRLYEQRETIGGKPTLTLKAWRALGALDGAIDTVAEEKFDSLGAAEQAALPRLLRALVASGPSGALTLRPAPLASAAHDDAAERLIAALVEARVLVSGEDAGHAPMIALTHQRVVEAWKRAKTIIGESQSLLRVRDETEVARERWESAGKRADLLLPPGMRLSEAEVAVEKLGEELPLETRGFIAVSAKAARRRRWEQILAIAAPVLMLLGMAALWQWRETDIQRTRAEMALLLATRTANDLVIDVSQKTATTDRVSAGLRTKILSRARVLQEQLLRHESNSEIFQRARAAALDEMARNRFSAGDVIGALSAAREAITVLQQLTTLDPSNAKWRTDLALTYIKVGGVHVVQGDLVGALEAYENGRNIFESLLAENPGNTTWQRDLSVSNEKVGDVLVSQGDLAGALKAYRKSLAIIQKLSASDPSDMALRSNLSVNLSNVGDVLKAQGDLAEALKAYREGLAVTETLSASDPGNVEWSWYLARSNERVGHVLQAQGDLAGALKSFENEAAITKKVVASLPDNAAWQRDLSVNYNSVGDVLKAQGDLAGALSAYRESLKIIKAASSSAPGNANWRRDLAFTYANVGDLLKAQGDLAGALKAYREALAIAEKLSATDPGNAQWRHDVLASYYKLSRADPTNARAYLLKAKAIAKELADSGKLAPSDANILKILDDALKSLDNPAKPTPPVPKGRK